MRYTIWQRDDYFGLDDPENEAKRIYMDADVVVLPTERIPITFDFQMNALPIGWLTDLRVEDGHITGEATWTDETVMNDDLIKDSDLIFGGAYNDLEFESEDGAITSAKLTAVSLVMHNQIPSRG